MSIEGSVVMTLDSSANFTDALAVLFASFYVFSMEYQEAAACTLELVQRQVNAFYYGKSGVQP